MARPLWFVKLIKKAFPSITFLAKLTNFPLFGKIFEFSLFRGDQIYYLPRDKTISIEKTIECHEEYVLPSQVLEYFVKKAKYHWIMDFCLCRSSMKCEDYPINYGCLFLGEATLGINPRLGKRVSKEEALKHLEECREAGLIHLIGRNKLDTQWLGVGPGNKLMTICNCCPCCCLWRVSPILNSRIGTNIKKMSGVNVKVNDKCIGCGTCTNGTCFVDAIRMVQDRAVISSECRGCGRCVSVCPQGAIDLTIEDKDYVKKAINTISTIVDVT